MVKKRGHGEAEYKTRASGKEWWRVRVTYPDGTTARPSGTAKNKTAARAAVAAKKAEAEAGQKPVRQALKVEEMVREYIGASEGRWAKVTTKQNEALLERHILPRLGQLKAAGVTPKALRAHFDYLTASGLGLSGQNQVKALLSGAYNHFIGDGVLRENPTLYARPTVKPVERGIKALTFEQAARFDAVCRLDRFALILSFILHTGVRLGEAVGLRWQDLGHEKDGAPFALIQNNRTEFSGLVIEGKPKTAAGRRKIYLSAQTAALVEEMRERQTLEERIHGKAGQLYVFPSTTGEPLSQDTVRGVMDRVLKHLGLPLTFSPHSLRHTFASLVLADAQVSIADVSKHLGHAQVSTTLNMYQTSYEAGRRRVMMPAFEPAKEEPAAGGGVPSLPLWTPAKA